MSYESWRISFQSAEQAAKSAYNDLIAAIRTRNERDEYLAMLETLVRHIEINTGYEPSKSLLDRSVDEAKTMIAKANHE